MIEIIKKIINRDILVRILKDNDWVLTLYNRCYILRNKKSFDCEMTKRSGLSIFDYKALSEEMPFCPYERIKDTNFYGQAYSLKQYANVNRLNYAIEHGLYYDDYVPVASYLSTVKKILTFSDIRENVLKKHLDKEILKVGPYIHYANDLLSEKETFEIKDKYGKILLFFPSHTCAGEGEVYDVNSTIQTVSKIATQHGFDSVFVNMYYFDILHSNYAECYEKAGFKVVTAGHRLDLNFLSRLRSIIKLSDYTISNNVGTHLGYCVYFKKPHFIFDNSIIEKSNINQLKEIGRCFYSFEDAITDQQLDIVKKYWGFNNLKTKDELHDILIK